MVQGSFEAVGFDGCAADPIPQGSSLVEEFWAVMIVLAVVEA